MNEEITVYTTPTCSWCNRVKDFLHGKGVNYQEVNVAGDDQAARKLLDLTGQLSVPVITKGNEVVVGFDQPKIEQLLQ